MPASIIAKKGEPLVLDVVRTTETTCATEIVIPELDLERPLPLGQVVSVEIPTQEARTLTYQCGMAMYKSRLVIQ